MLVLDMPKNVRTNNRYAGFGSYKDCGNIRIGARGDCVFKLQRYLSLFNFSVKVDGIFGTETLNAVRAFQASKGLPVDGVVGINTWNALLDFTPKTKDRAAIPIPTELPKIIRKENKDEKIPVNFIKYLPYVLIGGGLLFLTYLIFAEEKRQKRYVETIEKE